MNREGEWLCTVRLEGGAGYSYFIQTGSRLLVWTEALVWTSSLFLVVVLVPSLYRLDTYSNQSANQMGKFLLKTNIQFSPFATPWLYGV